METYTYSKKHKLFYKVEEVRQVMKDEFHNDETDLIIDLLIDNLIIIKIYLNEDPYIFEADLELCRRIISLNIGAVGYISFLDIDNDSYFAYKLRIREDTNLYYRINNERKIPAYVRNILIHEWKTKEGSNKAVKCELLGCTIETTNLAIATYVQNAIYRKHILDNNRYSEFTKSSSYMGSKKRLSGFVLESSIPFIDKDTVILDLMCGSGAMSNAFALVGDVFSSDAQKFCQLLAGVQGRGFNEEHAKKVIEKMSLKYRENLFVLQTKYSEHLQKEDDIFHMDTADLKRLLDEYTKFIQSTSLYSDEQVDRTIISEVVTRKVNRHLFPYCLFTLYFSNVFFGLSQCMELDSIKYAIDNLNDDNEKTWAMGILVIVVSIVASNYGGHFAQPKKITEKNILNIIRERQKSVWLEFNARFIAIAKASEDMPGKISIVEGPWQNAIKNVTSVVNPNKLLVYVDAPYKREEYSRYYHVLETMALYDYPSSEGKGRIRSKRKGERFKTVFATRVKKRIEDEFVKIISEILNAHSVCIWSYSNNGDVSIVDVLNRVRQIYDCEVYIYGTKYKHSMQGAVKKRKKVNSSKLQVLEYCIAIKLKGFE